MRRVIFNQKGGVGKSSITCNLAAVSARQGYRTLVVDMDIQGNSSYYLGYDAPNINLSQLDSHKAMEGTVAELLKQTVGWFSAEKAPLDFVQPTNFENLYLIPSSPSLEVMEKELESRYKIYKLRDAMKELSKEFDRIYIDTPPNFNFYSKSALIAAEKVLVPFDCDSFSRQAIYNLLNNVGELRVDHNKDLQFEGIVVNQFNRQARLPSELIAELKEEDLPIVDEYLCSTVKMKESHRARKPLIYYSPSHKLSQQFLSLFNKIEGISEESEPEIDCITE